MKISVDRWFLHGGTRKRNIEKGFSLWVLVGGDTDGSLGCFGGDIQPSVTWFRSNGFVRSSPASSFGDITWEACCR
ncbi:DUF2586 domain-containing protein [Sesbania bispinosa]|nr:DUF2586 domain-containing protein [Sesbania bispinosa]